MGNAINNFICLQAGPRYLFVGKGFFLGYTGFEYLSTGIEINSSKFWNMGVWFLVCLLANTLEVREDRFVQHEALPHLGHLN